MFTAQSRQLKIEYEDFSMSEIGYDTKKTLIFAVYLSVFQVDKCLSALQKCSTFTIFTCYFR